MESAAANPSCLVIGADKEKLVLLEENNKWVWALMFRRDLPWIDSAPLSLSNG